VFRWAGLQLAFLRRQLAPGAETMFRRVAPGTASRLCIVDHRESYGRHILAKIVRGLDIDTCIDIGCGHGDDLMVVRSHNPRVRCVGVDLRDCDQGRFSRQGIEYICLNVENQPLPFESDSVDLIIANQVLEHVKEVFWINHEIFRCLKVGGLLYLGVPNVLSLHNRILAVLGVHPTCAKSISAHVRVFSKRDTYSFYRHVAGGFTAIEDFQGSQFYPCPKVLARALATLFPALAVTVFFLIRKTANYNGEFIDWLSTHELETCFYGGRNTQ
jgi:SAM-dependent methyltransferase